TNWTRRAGRADRERRGRCACDGAASDFALARWPAMTISRRRFVAGLASGAALGLWPCSGDLRAKEAHVVSWPSRVVQLPADDESHKPPVVTAVRLHKDGNLLATAGDDRLVRVWNPGAGHVAHQLTATPHR